MEIDNILLEIAEKLLEAEKIWEFSCSQGFLVFLENVLRGRGFKIILIDRNLRIFRRRDKISGIANKKNGEFSFKIWDKELLEEYLYYLNIWSTSPAIRR